MEVQKTLGKRWIYCNYCNPPQKMLKKQYKLHLIHYHHKYLDGSDIEDSTVIVLNKISERVLDLLIRKPETRGSDELLILSYLRHKDYNPLFKYNPETKKNVLINPDGFTDEEWLKKFRVYEDLRRCREGLQHEALENRELGIASQIDLKILPSEEVIEKRRLRDKYFRKHIKTIFEEKTDD